MRFALAICCLLLGLAIVEITAKKPVPPKVLKVFPLKPQQQQKQPVYDDFDASENYNDFDDDSQRYSAPSPSPVPSNRNWEQESFSDDSFDDYNPPSPSPTPSQKRPTPAPTYNDDYDDYDSQPAPAPAPSKKRPKPQSASSSQKSQSSQKKTARKNSLLERAAPKFEKCDPNLSSSRLKENGLSYGKEGNLDGAKECFEFASELEPEDEKIWTLLGEIALHMGNHSLAESYGLKCLEINSKSSDGHFILGNAAMARDKFDIAIEQFKKAIDTDPKNVNAMVNLGAVLGNLHNYADAVIYYEKAIEIKPNLLAAKHNLGAALHSLKRYEASLKILTELCKEDPEFYECHLSLGHVLRELKRLENAREEYGEAMRTKPESVEALLNYFYIKQQLVEWEDRNELFEQLHFETQMQLKSGELTTVAPYFSLLSPFEPSEMLAIAKLHAKRAQEKINFIKLPESWYWWKRQPLGGIVRVAYISADFRMHVTAHLIQTIFARHDRDQFEIFIIALNANDKSSFRNRIEESVGSDHFLDFYTASDDAVAVEINEMQLNVVIDIDYYKGRIGILALQPAPIIVNWLAHPGTCGAAFVRHIVVDQIVAPPEHSQYFSESIVYMKHHYQVNDHPASYPHLPFDLAKHRKEENLPLDHFVMANFNGLYKVEPEVFAIWMRVLKKVPKSVLWLISETADSNNNVRKRAKELGVDPSRLIMAERADFDKHILRAAAADVFLDCFTYNAHTTATDVLWVGVPVVTYPGVNMQNRLAAGVMWSFGSTAATVARTPKEYEEMLLILAREKNRTWLKDLMRNGQRGLMTRRLFDTQGWIEDFESGLRGMVEIFGLKSARPRSGTAGYHLVTNPKPRPAFG